MFSRLTVSSTLVVLNTNYILRRSKFISVIRILPPSAFCPTNFPNLRLLSWAACPSPTHSAFSQQSLLLSLGHTENWVSPPCLSIPTVSWLFPLSLHSDKLALFCLFFLFHLFILKLLLVLNFNAAWSGKVACIIITSFWLCLLACRTSPTRDQTHALQEWKLES